MSNRINIFDRKERSRSELIKASKNFYYEMWMLSESFRMMSNIRCENNAVPPDKQSLNNALLEDFLVHARGILDFFYARDVTQEDDVIAEDFFDNNISWRNIRKSENVEKTLWLEKVHPRVGKEIAHLTYVRQNITPEEKNWNPAQIYCDIWRVLQVFLVKVGKEKLHESIDRLRENNQKIDIIPVHKIKNKSE